MANIVELRGLSDDRLEDMLEDNYTEMFNLRFQKASAQLENTVRVRQVRREIAQLKTVLHMRRLAEDVALEDEAVFNAVVKENWRTNTEYVYEEEAWKVEFVDEDGNELISTLVNLNKKKPMPSRRERKGKVKK